MIKCEEKDITRKNANMNTYEIFSMIKSFSY